MAVFAYKALDATGRTAAGTLLADSPAEGRRQLRQRGVRIEHFAPAAERPGSTGLQWTSRARRQACVAEFARLLCLLIGACAIGTLLVVGHAATAEEIIRFAHRLVHRDPSLFVSSVRINAGRGKNTQTWSVELTVSYLVYG